MAKRKLNNLYQLKMFSERFKKKIKTLVENYAYSNAVRVIVIVLWSIICFISGLFTVASSLSPRVSAIEEQHQTLLDVVEMLKNNDLAQTTKLDVLVLYMIPASERDKLYEQLKSK